MALPSPRSSYLAWRQARHEAKLAKIDGQNLNRTTLGGDRPSWRSHERPHPLPPADEVRDPQARNIGFNPT